MTEVLKLFHSKLACVPQCVCPSHNIHAAFLFQSPDRKKVLTTQRTFDSEGEKKTQLFCFHSPFVPNFSLPVSVLCAFQSLSSKYFITKFQHVLPNNTLSCRRGALPELPGEGLA